MQKVIHRAESRGFADHGWLKSHHTFSFANYHNPERMNFGLLRVLNDDWVEPNKGFGTHPHKNMEIVSIPLEGALIHKDSMGNEHRISKGEIQRMSAGSGVTHSEFNASETEDVNFLQIWILPQEANISPGYGQKKFDRSERKNKFQIVVSPDARDESIAINQEAFVSLANIERSTALSYEISNPDNGVYLFVISGQVKVLDETLKTRDAMGVFDFKTISISSDQPSELLAIEVPMQG